jgi:exodeoxyribonuclease-1|tara:strand:- start:3917 stop:4183 length:267 start_codon:yes stop_codon:yes gene_type:complete
MMPLMIHPTNQNAIICANLSHDPRIFNDPFGELQHRAFKCNSARIENIDSPSLLSVHLNRSPMVATPRLIDSQITRRLYIDLDKCRAT